MHIVYPVHLPNGYQICITGMALEGRMEGKSISHPRIAFGEIVHASLKPQVVGKHHFCGAWYGDYGMVSMETKEEEKKSPLRLFLPPRPFSHSHWESGYEGYVIEGKPCSNEEFEMHRMYQYASPFTVLEFKANSSCVLYDKDEQHLFSIEDVCSLFPLLQRGWPLSMLVKTLSLPSKKEWKEDTTVEVRSCCHN